MAVGLVYKYYYPNGDTWGYFHDASYLLSLADQNFSLYIDFMLHGGEFNSPEILPFLKHHNERAILMSKIVSLSLLFFGKNYWFASQIFSFLSFSGCWLLVNQLVSIYPRLKNAALVSFLYFPSFVFWSSGILKESLLIATITFCVTLALAYKKDISSFKKIIYGVLIVGGLIFIFKLKYYYGIVLSPLLALFVLYHCFIKKWDKRVAIVLGGIILIGSFTLLSRANSNLKFERVLSVIVDNNHMMLRYNDEPNNNILLPNLEANVFSFLKYTPKTIWEGFFRPYLWEVHNITSLVISIENTLILLLISLSLYSFKANSSFKMLSSDAKLEMILVLIYSFVLLLFLSLAVPNLGALSRYKIGFMPFFLMLVLAQLEVGFIDDPIKH
ncbi:hypothetical protein [Sediminitomix flava]|uniref:Dolichyl-phosphate-mannose-protein mannosyltransferase n=1 Tax=Sediminitomix flava TaxID=379075 RepID=A0A315ZBS3_SEDFL|nr:hypothetical protein [Sediminitomix flava]PWJ42810.1 hypothetical protein BC781_102356 [Sediminitomix flava]